MLKLCRVASVAAIWGFIGGCGWFVGEIHDEEVTELHQNMRAQKRETVFTQSLKDLGKLLEAYYMPRTPVQSKNIGNQTAKKNVPSDLYTMVAAAINKIGPQVVFVPFDAQYVISEASTGGNITRLYPKVVMAGGITGFDKDMFEKEREAEAAGGWAGAQGGGRLKASGNYSRVTVDLSLLDYKTQSYFPGVISSNSIVLQQDSLGWGIYGYYMGNGAAFDYDLKRKQGVHAALRTLVEFSVIEVLGKYFEVPYWRCIKGAYPDTDMINLMRERFVEKQKEEQQLMVKKLLFLHGYNGIDRASPVFRSSEEGALKEAMRRTKASTMTQLYMELWRSVPLQLARKRVRIDRRRQARIAQRHAVEQQKLAAKRAADEVAEKKRLEQQHKLKVQRYNALVTRGDKLFNQKQYKQAQTEYSAAHQLFGGEHYPIKMINRINAIQGQQRAAADSYRRQVTAANQLYARAESDSFNYGNYKRALKAYEQALRLKPDEPYLLRQVKKIKQKMSKYNTVLQTEGEDEW